jgi:glycosyltransferase involved in cell wall biosynthesis
MSAETLRQGPDLAHGAVLYDFLQVRGGAEKVSLSLGRGLGAEICVMFRNRDAFSDADLAGLYVRELGRPASFAAWRVIKGMSDFRHRTAFLRDGYDWVIYSGTNAPQAVFSQSSGRKICYCHTIPRFAYDMRERYLRSLAVLQRPVLHALVRYVRPRYESAMAEMDLILANSENVRRRIRTYLGLDSVVVHPPVSVQQFRWIGTGDYYLSTARLEPYKRVDKIVEAFLRMPDKRLVVASGGSDFKRIRAIAGGAPNIQFTGWLTDTELRRLMGRCLATLYVPLDEDFGISPVESMAAGKPVIGVAEGGLTETVVPGKTGILLDPDPDSEAIRHAVTGLDQAQAVSMRAACEARAAEFSEDAFLKKVRSHLLTPSPRSIANLNDA